MPSLPVKQNKYDLLYWQCQSPFAHDIFALYIASAGTNKRTCRP